MLSCVITSPTKKVRYEKIKAVDLPALSGHVQILPGHAEAFFAVKKGTIIIEHESGEREDYAVPDCECHVRNNEISVIV